MNTVWLVTVFAVKFPGCKDITFCISRDICSAAADTSNGEEPAVGTNTKPKPSTCAQSFEPSPKKRRNSDDQWDTSFADEDKDVTTNIKGPASELPEGMTPQSSRLNKKYEISLADEKYVCLCAVELTQSVLFVTPSCVYFNVFVISCFLRGTYIKVSLTVTLVKLS
jgi:hypothetical protein